MHTDEFEISLHRELKVCENTIQRIKKTLGLMEQKHHKTTEAFSEEYRSGKLDADTGKWRRLPGLGKQRWIAGNRQDLEQLYREQFRKMKI